MVHDRIVDAGYTVVTITAKETYIGEPRTVTEIIKKILLRHYAAGILGKEPKKGL
jgi:hypothetical protein